MSETRVSKWLRMQSVTWHCDEGATAARIVLETSSGEQVQQWPSDLKDLEQIVEDCIAMQADELPQGAHGYRLVAYSEKNQQLGELPQTIRGRSKDATSAAAEHLQMQKALALEIANMARIGELRNQEFEAQQRRLNDQYDNVGLLLDRNAENASVNFDASLRLKEFDKKQERLDMVYAMFTTVATPLLTMAVEKFGPKLLSMKPSEIIDKVKDSFSAEPDPTAPEHKAPSEADVLQKLTELLQPIAMRLETLELAYLAKEGPTNGRTDQPTPQRPSDASYEVLESGQAGVSQRAEERCEGNSRNVARGSRQRSKTGGTEVPRVTKRTTRTNHQRKVSEQHG